MRALLSCGPHHSGGSPCHASRRRRSARARRGGSSPCRCSTRPRRRRATWTPRCRPSCRRARPRSHTHPAPCRGAASRPGAYDRDSWRTLCMEARAASQRPCLPAGRARVPDARALRALRGARPPCFVAVRSGVGRLRPPIGSPRAQVHAEEAPGDVLVFLTGQDEIEALARLIAARCAPRRPQPPAAPAAARVGSPSPPPPHSLGVQAGAVAEHSKWPVPAPAPARHDRREAGAWVQSRKALGPEPSCRAAPGEARAPVRQGGRGGGVRQGRAARGAHLRGAAGGGAGARVRASARRRPQGAPRPPRPRVAWRCRAASCAWLGFGMARAACRGWAPPGACARTLALDAARPGIRPMQRDLSQGKLHASRWRHTRAACPPPRAGFDRRLSRATC